MDKELLKKGTKKRIVKWHKRLLDKYFPLDEKEYNKSRNKWDEPFWV